MDQQQTLHTGVSAEQLATIEVEAGTPIPAWLAGADAEEQRELDALGVGSIVSFDQEADRDALASKLLRQLGEYEADLARYDTAEAAEHTAIKARYTRLRAPSASMRDRLDRFMDYLALGAIFTGKAKSRKVGWGSYGRRKNPARVEFTDAEKATTFLREKFPAVVQLVPGVIHQDTATIAVEGITHLIQGQPLTSQHVSALSFVRGILTDSAQAKVGKKPVLDLLQGENAPTIPGAELVGGDDKPWYEVEPLTEETQ